MNPIKLSALIGEIQTTIENRFRNETFWVTAQIVDVKKMESKKWCYLKFIEKGNNDITTEIRGVFWSHAYGCIDDFEKNVKQKFTDGIEITCQVKVKFHQRYGMSLEVQKIDFAYALGLLELERLMILERLVKENLSIKLVAEGIYRTHNNSLQIPLVIKRIALITAHNSDGQRDFKQEIINNEYGYKFIITEFLTQVQGENASQSIISQLKLIEAEYEKFDVVAIVRGGGSGTDFRSFDDYELARLAGSFPVPIFTGIGHDRNVSIVDLMARAYKTPTKVAAFIVDRNFDFENSITDFKERIIRISEELIENASSELTSMKRLVKSLSPAAIINKGFAIVMADDKIITDPKKIKENASIQTLLRNSIIHSTVTKKETNEKESDI